MKTRLGQSFEEKCFPRNRFFSENRQLSVHWLISDIWQTWFFGSFSRFLSKFSEPVKAEKSIEFYFYVTRASVCLFLAFISICPDLTIDLENSEDGRLYIPSESTSKIVRGFHRFQYLWSYTWPKSLVAKIQLILCFLIMISTRVCNVLLPYYSKIIVDKLTAVPLPGKDFNPHS